MENKQMNNKFWTNDLIGVLAEDDPLAPFNKSAIFINSQDCLQFLIKLISQPSDSFPNVTMLSCFASELDKWGFEDDPYSPDERRKEHLREFLQGSLIVFNAERRILHNHTEVYNANHIRLIPKAESYHESVSLFPLPIFSQEIHQATYSEFIDKLKNRKFVGRIENISNEPNDTPLVILWKKSNYEYAVIGEFDKHQYAHGGFGFSIRNGLREANFLEEWLDDSYVDQTLIPNVMFVPMEIYQYLTGMMEAVEPLHWLSEIKSDTSILNPESSREVVQPHSAVAVLQRTPSVQKAAQSTGEPDSPEHRFIEHFVATTHELGLLYSEKDLINFHTAMKSSNLVLLAGMSGTGKSKLVHAYSRALGLYSDQFTFIPVRPSWTDDADLIGYADTLHMVYRPGDSGLINALKQAEKEEDKLFVICFDEMNLARVEHYFSQFLSILEMEPGRRLLRLYNDELANRLYNSAQYPPTITIKDNVMFVGTVNLDESTYHFSDKVLDRANVIQLEVLPFSHLVDLGDKKKVVHSRDQVINYEAFDLFKNKNRNLDLLPDEIDFLWELHCELQKVNKQMGVGQRIVRQMDAYLKNLPELTEFTREDALDLQIVQRILTKVRGSEDQLYLLIGNYEKNTGHIRASAFLDLLMKYSHLSHFERTRRVLMNKARELKQNGYTV
jgi:energy-coupling factor transporter ATP-binding protein EcfA2